MGAGGKLSDKARLERQGNGNGAGAGKELMSDRQGLLQGKGKAMVEIKLVVEPMTSRILKIAA